MSEQFEITEELLDRVINDPSQPADVIEEAKQQKEMRFGKKPLNIAKTAESAVSKSIGKVVTKAKEKIEEIPPAEKAGYMGALEGIARATTPLSTLAAYAATKQPLEEWKKLLPIPGTPMPKTTLEVLKETDLYKNKPERERGNLEAATNLVDLLSPSAAMPLLAGSASVLGKLAKSGSKFISTPAKIAKAAINPVGETVGAFGSAVRSAPYAKAIAEVEQGVSDKALREIVNTEAELGRKLTDDEMNSILRKVRDEEGNQVQQMLESGELDSWTMQGAKDKALKREASAVSAQAEAERRASPERILRGNEVSVEPMEVVHGVYRNVDSAKLGTPLLTNDEMQTAVNELVSNLENMPQTVGSYRAMAEGYTHSNPDIQKAVRAAFLQESERGLQRSVPREFQQQGREAALEAYNIGLEAAKKQEQLGIDKYNLALAKEGLKSEGLTPKSIKRDDISFLKKRRYSNAIENPEEYLARLNEETRMELADKLSRRGITPPEPVSMAPFSEPELGEYASLVDALRPGPVPGQITPYTLQASIMKKGRRKGVSGKDIAQEATTIGKELEQLPYNPEEFSSYVSQLMAQVSRPSRPVGLSGTPTASQKLSTGVAEAAKAGLIEKVAEKVPAYPQLRENTYIQKLIRENLKENRKGPMGAIADVVTGAIGAGVSPLYILPAVRRTAAQYGVVPPMFMTKVGAAMQSPWIKSALGDIMLQTISAPEESAIRAKEKRSKK